MHEGNRGNRESGFFLKRGSSNAALRVGLTRIDALDRRLAHEVEAATAVDAEIGFVLVCLRLQLLTIFERQRQHQMMLAGKFEIVIIIAVDGLISIIH